MHNLRLISVGSSAGTVDPIIRLWVLRPLVSLEGCCQLIGFHSFDKEEIAPLSGCFASSSIFNAHKARQKLYRCYQAAEKQSQKQVSAHFSLPIFRN
ncbi:hypothetical protein [Methylobacter psychrophilus]|uniref:hypothetical protein n=1 Tax=Methylobacter psychrophilus TaxID=96941 RepID=UPI0021D4A2F7|nr:hypothetical protein [Methylobacter psychrophilus]